MQLQFSFGRDRHLEKDKNLVAEMECSDEDDKNNITLQSITRENPFFNMNFNEEEDYFKKMSLNFYSKRGRSCSPRPLKNKFPKTNKNLPFNDETIKYLDEEYERVDFRPKTPFQKKRTPQYNNYNKDNNIENNKNISGIRALLNEVRRETAGEQTISRGQCPNGSKLKTIKLNEPFLTDRPSSPLLSPYFNKGNFSLMPKLKTEDQINDDHNILFNINIVVTNQSVIDQAPSKNNIVDASTKNIDTGRLKKLKPIKRVKSPDNNKIYEVFEEEKKTYKFFKEKEIAYKNKNDNLRYTKDKTEIEELKSFLKRIYRQLDQKDEFLDEKKNKNFEGKRISNFYRFEEKYG